MLTSTTPHIAERQIAQTLGVVSGEAIIGAHIFRDLFAGIHNIIGGRAGGYEKARARHATSPSVTWSRKPARWAPTLS